MCKYLGTLAILSVSVSAVVLLRVANEGVVVRTQDTTFGLFYVTVNKPEIVFVELCICDIYICT